MNEKTIGEVSGLKFIKHPPLGQGGPKSREFLKRERKRVEQSGNSDFIGFFFSIIY